MVSDIQSNGLRLIGEGPVMTFFGPKNLRKKCGEKIWKNKEAEIYLQLFYDLKHLCLNHFCSRDKLRGIPRQVTN